MGETKVSKDSKTENVFERIHQNYRYLNQMMVEEIDIASEHGTISGNYREEMWVKFFRSIIPLKYSLAQGVIIIDSNNQRSREVDIAVYDETYTPYVFQYNTLKFIPIEAVVAAIECKSTDWDYDKIKDWATSIKKLQPRTTGIARMVQGYVTGITNTSQQRTRPILILASNFQRERQTAIDNVAEELKEEFDFILLKNAESGSKGMNREFHLLVNHEDKTLGWWGKALNFGLHGTDNMSNSSNMNVIPPNWKDTERSELKKEVDSGKYIELKFSELDMSLENTLSDLKIPGNPLLTLNFQLNQLLMLLNNPMLFPHFAYARAFQKLATTGNESTKEDIN
ncbi:hypothetical protein HPL003_18785 [Paenibacillus terrae HPL-003]|uniref:DUF6602 domain-containing protein n=1 Tax=Paenibacillus terrae (strain HPL-003) TaxID=985665 RepID=G7W4U9_PAETH|nr:DUF6602 domain-containing protein [Paenibacillus terrae]AET60499.1 hypothetical protein HPL003_18785 [Paenibacillus terrae HPL-003]